MGSPPGTPTASVRRVAALLALAAGLGVGVPCTATAQDASPPTAAADDRSLVAKLADPAGAAAAESALTARGADAVPALIEGVANPKSRPAAVRLLTRLGPAAKSAIPTLSLQIRSHTNPDMAALCSALGAICDASPSPAATDGLAAVIAKRSEAGRAEAIAALGHILVRQGTPADPTTRVAPEVSRAISGAMSWLLRHQDPDGSWNPSTHSQRCSDRACGPAGSGLFQVGVTGLALTALLRSPGLAQDASNRAAADRAAAWLRGAQTADGSIGPRTNDRWMYEHFTAGMALAEHARVTSSADSRTSAAGAVRFALAAQNPYLAWRYGVRSGDNDTSATSRAVEMIATARAAGCLVPDRDVTAAMHGAQAWVNKVTHYESSRVGYQMPGGLSARTTAVQDRFPADLVESTTACGALISLHAAKVTGSAPSPSMPAYVKLLMAKPPRGTGGCVDLYYWYNGGEAMSLVGGREWHTWWLHARRALLENMVRGGTCAAGSFGTDDPWTGEAGRVYATAMAALCLERGIPDPSIRTTPTPAQAKLIAALRDAAAAPGTAASAAREKALAAVATAFDID